MKDNKLTLVIVIVAIIGMYLIVNEFTGLFGKSEKEQQQEKEADQLNDSEVLNNAYLYEQRMLIKAGLYGKPKDVLPFLNKHLPGGQNWGAVMNSMCDAIWDAKATVATEILTIGIVHDKEDAVFAVFNALPSKFACAFFANYFQKRKARDLVGFMQTFMNTEELSKVYRIIDKKPEI